MRKVILTVLVALGFVLGAVAQDRTITGKVTDEANKPIVGATVNASASKKSVITNEDGVYSIVVNKKEKRLTVSYTGTEDKQIDINNNNLANVSLVKKDNSLDEIVVVGYQVRKKREEGGAVASVKGKQIQNLPNVSVDRALQGRAAGVLVQGNNGIPGGAINVRIRGNATFGTNTQPLYVVDGIQINNRLDGGFTESNPLAFLNPNDVESIDVLKDAASASIYGAQAANGVVLITTKKGKSGKTKFTFGVNNGFTNVLKKFDVLTSSEYVNARAEADFNRFGPQSRSINTPYPFLESQRWALGELSSATGLPYTRTGFTAGQAGIYQTSSFNQAQADSLIGKLPNTDWQDAAIQQGVSTNFDFGMSGGNEKTTFALSANYTKQEAAFKKVDFTRYGLSADITHKANNRLTVGTKINLSSFDQKAPFSLGGSFLGNPSFSSPLVLPANPIYNSDGTYFGLPPSQALAGVLNQNIVAVNDFNSSNQTTNQMVGAITINYKIADWISYRGFVSLDYRIVQGKQYRDPRTNDGFGVRGRATVQSIWNTNLLTTQILNFNSKITKKLKFDGLLGYEQRSDFNEGINAAGISFPSSDFQTVNAAATAESVGEFYTGYKRVGVFTRANFNYDDKYIVSLIGRRDGSSRFGDNFKFGNFGGIIGTWNLEKENFLKNSKTISQLKLRASYGVVGDDATQSNFEPLDLYNSGSQYNGAAGINYGSIKNPNIKWQRGETVNLGVDYGLFQNKITGSVEVFERKTKDAILTRPLSWLNGIGSFSNNIGEISVKGIEASINIDVIRPKKEGDFAWTTNFNFSFQYNNVTELYNGLEFLPSDPSIRVGRSNNSVFTQVYQGVNPATGRPMYLDTFNNVTYLPIARDRRYIGDQEPDYFGGFSNAFSYKGFTLDVLFNYEYGRLATDGQVNFMLENGNRTFNSLREPYENRWKNPGDITSTPRIFDTGVEPGGVNHTSASSRLWKKADFIRLRDIKLSYTLPSNLLKTLKLNSLLFYVQGQNLFTYTGYWGYDPEFIGASTGIIPQTRNINVGLQLGF
jgi:TonB-dependent starch-binding outer membrane protein SusC